MEGSIVLADGERVNRDFYVSGETAYFKLRGQDGGFAPFLGRSGMDRTWDLRLSPTVATRVRVSTGVGQSVLDLSRVQVTDLSVSNGVGTTTLTLPAKGQLPASIDGGVGEVNVLVPVGMAARITADTGLGDVRVAGDFSRQGNVYVSPGYETALNRVDLRVHGGVRRITVEPAQQ